MRPASSAPTRTASACAGCSACPPQISSVEAERSANPDKTVSRNSAKGTDCNADLALGDEAPDSPTEPTGYCRFDRSHSCPSGQECRSPAAILET
jgi:hypothetical protein